MKKILRIGIFILSLNAFSQNASNLDTTFGTGGKVFTDFNGNSEVGNDMVIQPDGKIILAGTGIITTANGYDFCVARYNIDGSLDTTFGVNGKANFEITNFNNSTKRDYATGVALQSDGKIVISGYCPESNFSSADNQFSVIRLNSNGTLDTTYGSNGILRFGFGSDNCVANAMTIQPDNKVVIVGYSKTSSTEEDFAIARVNIDGTLDTDFSNDGKLIVSLETYDRAQAVTIQNDGKILVGGDANGKIGLVRITEFGNLDSTFGTGGKVLTDLPSGSEELVSIKTLSNGKIVGGGTRFNSQYNLLLIRYNTDGTLDTTFGNSGNTTIDLDNTSEDLAKNLEIQNDGKIILVGDCYSGGTFYFAVTRCTADGIIDSSFSGDGIQLTTMNSADANAVKIQNDGKIIVGGGNFLGGGNSGNFAIARYLGDSFLGINDFVVKKQFLLSPNPAKNYIQINFLNEGNVNYDYAVLDINGRIVDNGSISTNINQINIGHLTNGLYVLKINNENIKFIKE